MTQLNQRITRFAILPVVFSAIALFMSVWIAACPRAASAQTSDLRVVIFRPGEGESLYSNPSAPFAAVPITGQVSTNDFDLSQLTVRLEVLKGNQITRNTTIKPEKDGTFRVDAGINPNPVSDQAELEMGCDSRCHSMQTLVLPAGPLRLRVTVSDPVGHKAVAERSVIVDNTGYVDLPVQVTMEENSTSALAGVKVVASTRLYLWRTREYSALTDAAGRATIHLERLSEMPTDYVLQIEPGIVNGAYVAGRVPVTVTLPAGATNLASVNLSARAQLGQINGSVSGLAASANTPGLTVRAVEAFTGVGHTAPVSEARFSFADLPLSKYQLALDAAQGSAPNVSVEPQTIDLGAGPVATVTLKLASGSTRTTRGLVHDASGNPLPFAWIATSENKKVGRVGPTSGEFMLGGLVDERVLWVTAPGYWSRPVAAGDRLDIGLAVRPDTRSLAWGSGSVTLPSQTLAGGSGSQISLRRGWIWGKGTGALTVRTPELDIALRSGSFALEYLPGETNWLYLRDGQAEVTSSQNQSLTLNARQMLAFGKGVTRPSPVPLDDAVVQVLHLGEASQVPIMTDASPIAHLVDEVERNGIPFVWAIVSTAIVIAAAAGALVLRRRRALRH